MIANKQTKAAAVNYIAGGIGLRGNFAGGLTNEVVVRKGEEVLTIHVRVVSNLWNPDSNWNPMFSEDIRTDFIAILNNERYPEIWIIPTSTFKAHLKYPSDSAAIKTPYLPKTLLKEHLRLYRDNWALKT